MGRARQTTTADAFATVFGSTRGSALGNALSTGAPEDNAQAFCRHLLAQQQAGDTEESLAALTRYLRVDTPVDAPLRQVLSALAEASLAAIFDDDHWQKETSELLEAFCLRTNFCHHIVSCRARENGVSPTLHFSTLSTREFKVGQDLPLRCGRSLNDDASNWSCAERGDWLNSSDSYKDRCGECAVFADEFEESREDWPYPALSESQRPLIRANAENVMRILLKETVDAHGPSAQTITSLALFAYQQSLRDYIANVMHTAGEWPFRDGVLRAQSYDKLLALAGTFKLTGILNESDWRVVAGAVTADVFTFTPTREGFRSTVEQRLIDALTDRINGRVPIAL
jgi:hypothetical protein